MKLQSASRKELKRIALGVAVCDGILIAGLFLLSLVGIGSFDLLRILLGIAGGSAIAIGNFAVMCLTVQTAVDITDQKKMKAFFQASYNGRLLLQAGWVIVSILVPGIHIVAGAAPLLFPHVIILYLSAKGKLVTPSDRKNPPAEETGEPEDRLESFEI
jgi:hypothetical protein